MSTTCARHAGNRVFPAWRVLTVGLLLVVTLFAARADAAGLSAKVTGFARAGAALRVSVEVRNALTDRWRAAMQGGTTLYVRVQAEMWERRTLWDRLVRPAAVSVARVTAEPNSHSVIVVDAFGHAELHPPALQTFTLLADVLPVDRIEDAKLYYVHAVVTVGTIAESDISGVSDAVLGEDRSGAIGSLGKLLLQKVLQVADYLDSASCNVTSERLPGSEIRKRATQ